MPIRFPKGLAPTWASDVNYPAGVPIWSGMPTKSTLSAVQQAAGWTPEKQPPAQKLNDWMNRVGRLVEMIPELALRNWPYRNNFGPDGTWGYTALWIDANNYYGTVVGSLPQRDDGFGTGSPQRMWAIGGQRATPFNKLAISNSTGIGWKIAGNYAPTATDQGLVYCIDGTHLLGTGHVWLIGGQNNSTGGTRLYRSVDAGTNFTVVTLNAAQQSVCALFQNYLGSTISNMIAGIDQVAGATQIYTAAGNLLGSAFTQRNTPWTAQYVNGITGNLKANPDNIVLAIGESNTEILKSTDAGVTWTNVVFDGASASRPVGITYNEELDLFVLVCSSATTCKTYFSQTGTAGTWTLQTATWYNVGVPQNTVDTGKALVSSGKYIVMPAQVDSGGGHYARYRNVILYSDDLGDTWKEVDILGPENGSGTWTQLPGPKGIKENRGQLMAYGIGWTAANLDIGLSDIVAT